MEDFTLNGNYKWVELPRLVKLQRAQASHHWHAIRRRNSRDRRKTLGHSVQIKIAGTRCKIQSRFSTREQVQDDFWEDLHAKLDHRSVYNC